MFRKSVAVLAISLMTLYASSAAYADTIVSGDLVVRDSGKLYFPDGSYQDKAQMVGPKGDKGDTGAAGPANNLTMGTVTTGNPGTAAGASITGTAPNQVLNLLIPQGPKGETGSYGFNSLVSLADEAPGVNCTNGGIKISSGLDVNRSNVLDANEMTQQKFVCNGASSSNAVFTMQMISGKSYKIDLSTLPFNANGTISGAGTNTPNETWTISASGQLIVYNTGLGTATFTLISGDVIRGWNCIITYSLSTKVVVSTLVPA